METRNRIVNQAEALFFAKGYNAVSLKHICDLVKMKPPSLYYHFPGGKEEIYVEVIKLRSEQFKKAIQNIAIGSKELRSALTEFGLWYIEQPPMNMVLIAELDMPYLTPKAKRAVSSSVGQSLFGPLGELFEKFRHELRVSAHPHLLVGTFNVLLFSIHSSVKMGGNKPEELVHHIVDVFLHGISKNK